jgi:hypothetical protein
MGVIVLLRATKGRTMKRSSDGVNIKSGIPGQRWELVVDIRRHQTDAGY